MTENKMVKCINCDNAQIARFRTVYPGEGLATDWVIQEMRCTLKMPHVSEHFEGICSEFKQRMPDW